jgi:hypothetical protein
VVREEPICEAGQDLERVVADAGGDLIAAAVEHLGRPGHWGGRQFRPGQDEPLDDELVGDRPGLLDNLSVLLKGGLDLGGPSARSASAA